MSDFLLFSSILCLHHFTGTVRGELTNMAYEKIEISKVDAYLNKQGPEDIRIVAGDIAFVLNIAYDKRIVYKVSF